MLGASIAPNRCWGSKSVSRAQIGSARRGAWGFCGSFHSTHAPQPHRPPRLKTALHPKPMSGIQPSNTPDLRQQQAGQPLLSAVKTEEARSGLAEASLPQPPDGVWRSSDRRRLGTIHGTTGRLGFSKGSPFQKARTQAALVRITTGARRQGSPWRMCWRIDATRNEKAGFRRMCAIDASRCV
jgi:hypothetical protein